MDNFIWLDNWPLIATNYYKEQMRETKQKHDAMRESHSKLKFDLERRVKEQQRARLDLENEVRNLAN